MTGINTGKENNLNNFVYLKYQIFEGHVKCALSQSTPLVSVIVSIFLAYKCMNVFLAINPGGPRQRWVFLPLPLSLSSLHSPQIATLMDSRVSAILI